MLFYLRRIKRLNSPARIINFSLQQYRNQPFIIQPDKNLELSFRDFSEKVSETISLLRGMDVGRGDVLGFISNNSYEYFSIRAACHCLGVVFLGLLTTISDEDIVYFLRKSEARILFRRGDFEKVEKLSQEKKRFSLATLNLSSGTTRRLPKIVCLTKRNWTASLYNYILNSDVKPDKKIVFLCALPFVTAGSTTFLPSLLTGLTYIIAKEDSAMETLIEYIKRYKVNRLYITPSQLLELMEWSRAHNERLNSLENIITGTERMPPVKFEEAIDFFGPIISAGYGMVEVLPPLTMLSPRDYYIKGRLKKNVLGSVGRILKGVRIKVLDRNLKELSAGKIGRLAIKSSTVSAGYLNNEEENKACFKNGWFYTNDYGYVDGKGFVYLLGRQEEILTEEPRITFFSEIEDKIYGLPFVDRCAVLKKNGRIFLFVSLRDVKSEEGYKRIIEFCQKNLKNLLLPERIIIKEKLPINSVGKLDKLGLSKEIV